MIYLDTEVKPIMPYKITLYNGDRVVTTFIKQTLKEAQTSVEVCKVLTQLEGAENFRAEFEEIDSE